VPGSFAEVSNQFSTGGSPLKGLPRLAVIFLQPIIGSFRTGSKRDSKLRCKRRGLPAAGSTALNIVHNAVLYPLLAIVSVAVLTTPEAIFSRDTNIWV
jgi:hypothetical protein